MENRPVVMQRQFNIQLELITGPLCSFNHLITAMVCIIVSVLPSIKRSIRAAFLNAPDQSAKQKGLKVVFAAHKELKIAPIKG